MKLRVSVIECVFVIVSGGVWVCVIVWECVLEWACVWEWVWVFVV